MRVHIVVWQNVINPETGKVHNEEGLRALDAIRYGKIYETEDLNPDFEKKIKEDFENINLDFFYDDYKMVTAS